MIRGLSGLTVLLLLGILFVGGLLLVAGRKPPPTNPLEEAQQALKDTLGCSVELVHSPEGGLKILEVVPNELAYSLGLRPGDVVMAVNESSVWHAQDMLEKLQAAVQRGSTRILVKNKGVFRTVVIRGANSPSGPPPSAGRAGG